MRRLRPQEKKRVGEFRMIRGVDSDLNFSRFMKHVERLKRKFHRDRSMWKLRLRNRRTRRLATVRAESIALVGSGVSGRRRASPIRAVRLGANAPAASPYPAALQAARIPSSLPAGPAAANDE